MAATEAPPLLQPARPRCRRRLLRSVRPSILDLRFNGDLWLTAHPEGGAALCLGDYRLVRLEVSPLDVPSFYTALVQMRHSQAKVESQR